MYGKKLIFNYKDRNFSGQEFKIQYLQQIVERTKAELKSPIDIEIIYEQIGG